MILVIKCFPFNITLLILQQIMEKNGLMVSVWGPVGWKYLHSVAYGYPVNPLEYDAKNGLASGTTENNYKIFFTFVGKTLPCGLCRESYAKFITENPIRAKSRDELTRWLWEIHNMVNEKLGNGDKNEPFENTKEFYESFYDTKTEFNSIIHSKMRSWSEKLREFDVICFSVLTCWAGSLHTVVLPD